jgi:hypothetical protein
MRGLVFAALLAGAGCSSILGIQDLSSEVPDDGDTPPSESVGPAAECRAQRVVAIAAGNGGLSWFTLVWPVPFVINNFNPIFAFDDPARAAAISMDAQHPLFARRLPGTDGAVLGGTGNQPHPSVFVAGANETHLAAPSSVVSPPGSNGLLAAGAALQAPLSPGVRVMAIGNAGPYGTAPLAPSLVVVGNVDGAISVLTGSTNASDAELRPSAQQLANYIPNPGVTPTSVVNLATQLAFAANAFRANALGMLVVPGFNDDPHGAFADPNLARTRADQLATVLDAFYRDLSLSSERECGDRGNFLSLADNTVLLVYGDTFKNPFDRAGWPDGTPGDSNLLFLRGNGFTRRGWFGAVEPSTRINFSPITGVRDATVGNTDSTNAAWAASLYAISRGDLSAVQQYTNAPFQGTIVQAGP